VLPRFAPSLGGASDIWPLLAVLGAAGLAVEWLLYGRFRRSRFSIGPMLLRRKSRAASEARQ
jgi:hypothetical protein